MMTELILRKRRSAERLASPRTVAALRFLLVSAVVLTTGCAIAACGGGQQVVFDDSPGSDSGGGATTVDIVDVGIDLQNITGHSVRVLGVRLVSPPRAVRLLAVNAYPAPPGLGIGLGDMVKLCRKTYYSAHPVTDAVTAPHGYSWSLVLAIRFVKPGRYSLGLVRISYTTNGQQGWQYEHLNTTITVVAARPGTKPRFDGC